MNKKIVVKFCNKKCLIKFCVFINLFGCIRNYKPWVKF